MNMLNANIALKRRINQSYLKQKRINEYLKKITLNPGADNLKKIKVYIIEINREK
jgi:hypothetical protein